MTCKGWYEALSSALNNTKEPIMQLATVDESGTPHVRSHVWRTFVTAHMLPELPLLLTTTDIRTPKVTQMVSGEGRVEVVFWTPSPREQFRIQGRAWAVPAPNYGGTYPTASGVVYEALSKEGFDWGAKRLEVFDGIDERLKASWCRPAPGTPLEGGEEKKWPTRLPKLGEAESDEDKRNLATALSNFALILVEPFEVDYIELGVYPERRRRFKREERSIDFKETLLVP